MSKQNDQPTDKCDSLLGLFARLLWMLFGNLILFISIIFIAQYRKGVFHAADVVFWITAGVLILARYLDIKLWGGVTGTGKPASMADWRRYVVTLLGCCTAAWLLFHLIAYFASK
jgi:hypothetical protein